MSRPFLIYLASCVTVLAGCGSTPMTRPVKLEFLENAPVTRDYVIAQLGPANASFESERVLSYHLSQNEAGYNLMRSAHGWVGVNYDLVLAFDEAGVLQQHRLVLIRPAESSH